MHRVKRMAEVMGIFGQLERFPTPTFAPNGKRQTANGNRQRQTYKTRQNSCKYSVCEFDIQIALLVTHESYERMNTNVAAKYQWKWHVTMSGPANVQK